MNGTHETPRPAAQPDCSQPEPAWPRTARHQPPLQSVLSAHQRIAIGAFVALAHAVLLLTWLRDDGPPEPTSIANDAITVIFLAPDIAAPAPDPGPPPTRTDRNAKRSNDADRALVRAAPPSSPPRRSTATSPALTRSDKPMVAIEVPGEEPLQRAKLFSADGSVALPDDVVADLESVLSDDREFSYKTPGVMDAKRLLYRNPALVYEKTRFDENWAPTTDLLTSGLQQAVDATTGSIEIPVPSAPGTRLRCSASILAFGGGCGFVSADDNYIVELNDPNTLNPEEDKQCQAWWDQIVSATTQDTWRTLRRKYEDQCRKPLAAKPQAPVERD